MAQRVQIMLEDDVDGGGADETVTFGLDGVSYEIDLSAKNAARLRDTLATWVGHARRSGSARKSGGRRGRGSSSGAGRRSDLGAVREWARGKGHQVSDRGRISASVQEAYDKAHGRVANTVDARKGRSTPLVERLFLLSCGERPGTVPARPVCDTGRTAPRGTRLPWEEGFPKASRRRGRPGRRAG